MTGEDYLAWRDHPVTKEFMQAAVQESDVHIADLVNSAGDNPLQDKFRRGVIMGLTWLVEWVPTVEREVNIETEVDTDEFTSSGSQDSY